MMQVGLALPNIIKQMQDISLEPVELPFGKVIYQKKGLGVSSDSQALYQAVSKAKADFANALELGSGNGIVSLMLAASRTKWQILGIDIQPELVELSQQNAEICNLPCDFIVADLRVFRAAQKYEIIFSNPPFFPLGQGRISPQSERAISRHELMCTMPDLLACIKRNLAPTGTAWIIYPQSRYREIVTISKKVDLLIADKKNLKQNAQVIVELKLDITE